MIEKTICKACKQITIKTPLKVTLFNHGFCSLDCYESMFKDSSKKKKTKVRPTLENEYQSQIYIRTHQAKKFLDEPKVRQIKSMIASGISPKAIALELDVGIDSIYLIKSGKTWKHVS